MRLKKQGLTLTELLLAAAILAFVLSGLLALFISCLFLNENNRERCIALGHAQFVMEDIKNATYNVLVISAVKDSIDSGYWNLNSTALNNTYGLRSLKNETINTASSGSNPLGVVVNVTWKARGQTTGNRTVSLESLFTK